MQTTTCKRAACGLAVPPYQRAKPIYLPSNATDASRGRPPAYFGKYTTETATANNNTALRFVELYVELELELILIQTQMTQKNIEIFFEPFKIVRGYIFISALARQKSPELAPQLSDGPRLIRYPARWLGWLAAWRSAVSNLRISASSNRLISVSALHGTFFWPSANRDS